MILRFVFRRLAMYDSEGDGRLREPDLENYIFEAIPAVPELAALQENFYPFYVFTAVRHLLFFLDPNRTGRVKLRDLVGSRAFGEWLKVLPPGHPDLGPAGELLPLEELQGASPDMRALLEALQQGPELSWFSSANALRVYSAYLQLDRDQNGMLSPEELSGYCGGLYTPAFVQRVFEECHTYVSTSAEGSREIDYKTYLDIVLASENRAALPSLRFFFKLLDVQHRNCFGLEEIRHFYAQVQERLAVLGHEPVDAANVGDEIFDMVAPAVPGVITLEDLRHSKVGATVCGILLDASAFIAYDRREEIKCAGSEEEGSGCALSDEV